MCRRFALDLDWDAVARWLDVDEDGIRRDRLPQPSYNIAPMQTIGVVAQDRDGRRHLTGAHWTLVPRWSQSKTLPYPTYNARVESIHVKPTFAESTRSMRCVIPASGYYEWKGKRPFYFHAEGGKPLAMAGLYSWWRASDASPWQLTATIVTCPAVDGPASVHDRMPLLVPDGMTAAWLDRATDGVRLIDPLRRQGTELSRRLAFHEVAPLPASGNGRRLIRPVERTDPIRLL
ncbi:SOS response-associated peptidase [Bifidobacterium platyrrhinorum]|uniref:Abasic site processing protein n=1 Tax=Bifidobacterium platyrrhinorum TaxID=2661628 RepID=A0A6L9SQ83_9BIFI|nr:SOS response-associated peptidase [Bifidobacterium platyrrhinorum]NEG54678.1 SOS response-associated peptidase [Bifidobacterium platyrrhinorum]